MLDDVYWFDVANKPEERVLSIIKIPTFKGYITIYNGLINNSSSHWFDMCNPPLDSRMIYIKSSDAKQLVRKEKKVR